MAESLADMARQAQPQPIATPVADPSVRQTPMKAPAQMAGDELLSRTQGQLSLNDDEARYVKLFTESKSVVEAKMQESPAFAEQVVLRLQDKQGPDLAQALMDESDQIKIDYMKAQDPKRFNSAEAAKAAFFNEATFGQLTRIMGGVGAMIQGKPYEQVVAEQGEKFRLLQKAFPKEDITGKVSAYLIPGSPVKMLFDKVSRVGVAGASAILGKMSVSPGLFARVVESAAGGAAGAGTVEGLKGTVGSDLQSLSFDRGMEQAEGAAVIGGVTAGALPVLGALVSAGRQALQKPIRQAVSSAQEMAADLVEKVTGAPKDALRAWNKDAAAIRSAAGTENEIGSDLVEFLLNSKKSGLPEVKLADDLASHLPDVDASRLTKYLRSFGPQTDSGLDGAVKRLHEWADRFEAQAPGNPNAPFNGVKNTKIPASLMTEFKRDLQNAADDAFGKEASFYETALKVASRRARITLVDSADDLVRGVMKTPGDAKEFLAVRDGLASGNLDPVRGLMKPGTSVDQMSQASKGALYTASMEKAAEKMRILTFIQKRMGSSEEMMANNSEKFISNLFGKNKTVIQSRLKSLDARFDTNFFERAENAGFAKQIGNGGNPGLISNLTTGKGAMGTLAGGIVGTATGNPVLGLVAGTVATSPRAGAAYIGASDKIGGFLKVMVAKPEILSRIANKAGVAYEVRVIAQEIQNTLRKDGPISASGVTRLIADTPYFVGLVHAFDVAERDFERKTVGSGLAKQNQAAPMPQPEIATPKQ